MACIHEQTVELTYLQIHSQLLKHRLSILPLAVAALILVSGYWSFPLTATGAPPDSC